MGCEGGNFHKLKTLLLRPLHTGEHKKARDYAAGDLLS